MAEINPEVVERVREINFERFIKETEVREERVKMEC